jgi:hypothetical protein
MTCEGCGKEMLVPPSAGDNFICSDECREKVQCEKAISDQVQVHRAAIEALGRFGIVTWCDHDIVAALEHAGANVSPENVKAVREHYYVAHIDDRMTEAGFGVIADAICDLGLTTSTPEKEGKEMKPSDDDPSSNDAPTSTEQQQFAVESAPAPTPTEAENLDINFDDPRLAAELRKSQQMLEYKFTDLEHHIDAAAKLAKQIRALVDERLS